MAQFPSSIPSYTGFTSSHTLSQDSHASQHNSEQGDIVAIATKVGTGSSTPTNHTVLKGNGTGTSTWAQVDVSSADITGVLSTGNGGTGQTNLTSLPLASPAITGTVTGGATYSSPTLATPTIADFSNANHDHTSSSKGGALGSNTVGSSQIIDGSVAYLDLLSTIFSGQIQTGSNSGSAGGTTNYLNLGGVKICWGTTSGFAINAGTEISKQVNFPTTYSSSPIAFVTVATLSGVADQIVWCDSTPSTTFMIVDMFNFHGSIAGTNCAANWLTIGT